MTTQSVGNSCGFNVFSATLAVLALTVGCSPLALAKPGGEPLILDTQTGIHSGAGGTILQTGPMGGPGMVPMATLPQLSPQDPTTIVVSPYVEYSGGQTSGTGIQIGQPGQPMQPGSPGVGGGHHGHSRPNQGARPQPPQYQQYPQAPVQPGYSSAGSSTRWNGAARSGNETGQTYRGGTSRNGAATQTGATAGTRTNTNTTTNTNTPPRSTDPAQRANSRPAPVTLSTQDAGHGNGNGHSATGSITTTAP